ncbi:MAG TPA: NAD(P)H-quinone oxidoreductase [Pyrinomonadaceae bacterium]|jgi:putative PIG3 family NAD(P)H quinone oxidoreductase
MKAVYIKEFGGAENLEIRETENPPPPQNSQVLIRVRAAGLNRADILQRKGFYPAPPGAPERVPGLEFAGEVAEIGANVVDFKIGERVFGITAGGAQAEFLLTDASLLAKIPENLSFAEAAAVPEAFVTAADAVFTQGNLQNNETLLIHAVGSGVGLAALQLAKARNIYTIGTSRTSDKLKKCEEFGLDCGILIDTDLFPENLTKFVEMIRQKTDEKGINVILDLVGASYFAANLQSLAVKGRLILVGLTGGATVKEFNLGIALSKRLKITGTVLRSRSTAEKAEATRVFITEVLPLLGAGKIKPNIDRRFKAEEIIAAHEYLESNQSFGKVILEF